MSQNDKLNIINKLGNLLETGDNNQLEHIEKYLIDLNLDGSMGAPSASASAGRRRWPSVCRSLPSQRMV